jgi:SSS family solute:Na+ symporter
MISSAYLTLIVVLSYLILLKAVSYFANRFSQHTAEDFFVADRNIGVIALMGTIVATKVNALALTTAPAFIYEGGILFLQTFIALGGSFALLLYFGPKVWSTCKENQFITQAELFAHYYQSRWVHWLTTIVGILSIFPFLVVQFIAVAKVFSVATDQFVSFPVGIAILGFSTSLYIFWGGARAVIWTDVIQGLFLLVLILLTAILFTHWVGGYGQGLQILQQLIPEKLTFNRNNTPVFLDQSLSWSFAFFLWPQIFQRVMMGKSVQVIEKAAWGHLGLGVVIKLALMTIGIMATSALYGQISDSDRLVAAFYADRWPRGACLVTLAVFACGMSTIDSILLSLSSIFTRDVVENLWSQPLTADQEYRLAQWVSLLTLGLACGLALSPIGQGYLAPLVTLAATLATLLLWPLLGIFIWKGATPSGVISSLIVGLVSLLILEILSRPFQIHFPCGNTTIVLLLSGLSFILGSKLTSRSPLLEQD